MSQYDFGTIDPNTKSGTALASDLNSFRTALHTSHSGSTAPSYITTGMLWVDSTSANLKIKMYDGAQSIDVAIIDATNNVARVAVDSAATSYITATTAAQIKHVIAGVDTATIRSTGLQFNIAAPIIGDSSNNELISFTTTASAVNQINVANAATLTNPVISAVGNDTNIGITLTPKGTGRTNIGQLALDGTTITTTAAQLNFVTGVTSAIQTQLDAKAPLASPALTGTPTAPTAAAGTNTTQLATTAFVQAAGGYDAQIFSTAGSGTWTKPASAPATARVNIQMWGAGGGGARGASGNTTGGGGGAYTEYTVSASALAATVSVTVGAGGNGRSTDGNGNVGGNSIFNGVTAYGGGGGTQYTSSGGNSGGGQLAAGASNGFGGNLGGGTFIDGTGLTPPDLWGGAAGTQQLASGPSCFGGAGGAGKSSGTAGISKFGGNGGAIGGVGVAPAGGGGGSGTTSGAGARGEVRIYTTW